MSSESASQSAKTSIDHLDKEQQAINDLISFFIGMAIGAGGIIAYALTRKPKC